MEAISVTSYNTIVPRALNESNYEIWSSCMEDYLTGQDLWKVIVEAEPKVEAPDIKIWREKNAMALHAIKLCCGPNIISKVLKLKSAKEAWDLLAAAAATAAAATVATASAAHAAAITPAEEVNEYGPFINFVKNGDWESMKKFIDVHPRAVGAKVFSCDSTVLHTSLYEGHDEIVPFLVDIMTTNDMETQNKFGHTTLGVGALKMFPNRLETLKLMVKKHPNLPNIGAPLKLPVLVAAWYGFEEATDYLYSVTDKNILNPEHGPHGAQLLINCIESKIFGTAKKLVEEFPKILRVKVTKARPIHALAKTLSTFQSAVGHKKSSTGTELVEKFPEILKMVMTSVYTNVTKARPIHALAKTLSTFQSAVGHKKSRDEKKTETVNDKESIYDDARAFLRLVCAKVSAFDDKTLREAVHDAMIEAAENGNIEFINEMLKANPNLIWARDRYGRSMFVYAVTFRQEKVFNLLYGALEHKDSLLSFKYQRKAFHNKRNMLHLAATLPSKSTLDRISKSPALQIQSELQWFKEVWRLARPQYREERDNERLTPRELFDKSHEKLINSGEKLMKGTAQSCTTVGALIATIMFAAAFTVPGGNNQNTGYPLFLSDVLFKIFIACDAIALFSSTASILIFLIILTSSYVEEDFLLSLPKKIMMGLLTLIISIATMMITFCIAIAIMFGGRSLFILPIALFASCPVVLFLYFMSSHVYQLYMSTFGPSIFNKNTKLPERKEFNKIKKSPSSVATEISGKKGREDIEWSIEC